MYERERDLRRIPATIHDGKEIHLSPGGQNVLIEKILEDFCALFTPGGTIAYVGDAKKKWAVFDSETLVTLGVVVTEHGKMPDVVVYYTKKKWLVLIEAVTSQGPVNAKRRRELCKLFANSSAGLVFVTCFLDRQTMRKFLKDISWETEVWVAESPTHLIHFNGERFLCPYE